MCRTSSIALMFICESEFCLSGKVTKTASSIFTISADDMPLDVGFSKLSPSQFFFPAVSSACVLPTCRLKGQMGLCNM